MGGALHRGLKGVLELVAVNAAARKGYLKALSKGCRPFNELQPLRTLI